MWRSTANFLCLKRTHLASSSSTKYWFLLKPSEQLYLLPEITLLYFTRLVRLGWVSLTALSITNTPISLDGDNEIRTYLNGWYHRVQCRSVPLILPMFNDELERSFWVKKLVNKTRGGKDRWGLDDGYFFLLVRLSRQSRGLAVNLDAKTFKRQNIKFNST